MQRHIYADSPRSDLLCQGCGAVYEVRRRCVATWGNEQSIQIIRYHDLGLAETFNSSYEDDNIMSTGAGAANLAPLELAAGRSRLSLEREASHLADAKVRYLEVSRDYWLISPLIEPMLGDL